MAEKDNMHLKEEAEYYIALLKERFHGMTAEPFKTFKQYLIKSVTETEAVDRASMFTEVKALFAKHHDLVEKFGYFLYYPDRNLAPSNGEEYNEYRPSRSEKKSTQVVLGDLVGLLNRVKRTLIHEDEFKSFLNIFIGFEQDMDIEKVEREVSCLFKEHPELKTEFCEILAEGKTGRTVHNTITSKKRKCEEAESHLERRTKKCKKEKQIENYESFEREDELYKRDLVYNSMLRTKESANKLIMENSGMHPDKEIRLVSYFKAVDLTFMKQGLKRKPLLCKTTMSCGKALAESKSIVRRLEDEMNILTRDWNLSDDKKRLAGMNREKDLQIPVFDWHDA